MRRLAVAAVCVFVALSASALGEPVWTWSWYYPERQTDLTYDAYSNISLTKNSGTHAVALAWAAGDFWTTVVAEVRKENDADDYVDSVMSYNWDPDSRRTPFAVWRHDIDLGEFRGNSGDIIKDYH